MFLNQLGAAEKELYLCLCAQAVNSDGDFEQEEKEFLAQCCHEMMLPVHLPESDLPTRAILERLAGVISDQEKNIVIFELIWLLFQNGTFEQQENLFMSEVLSVLEIPADRYMRMKQIAEQCLDIQDRLNKEISN